MKVKSINVNVNINMHIFYNLFMQGYLHFYIVIFLHFYYIINNNEDYSIEKAFYSLELLKKVENHEYKYSDETIKSFDKVLKKWLN